MDTLRRLRVGVVTVQAGSEVVVARLRLTEDSLVLQKEELAYTYSPTDHVDSAILARERVVHVGRERVGGLGLSVKGGAEHNLPILVSRIFKDQAADKTGQLFVGDAVLKVNGTNIEAFRHDDAVRILKNAGDDVTLTVKYFHPASLFLNKTRRSSRNSDRDEENNQLINNANGNSVDHENNSETSQPEQQWSDHLRVPLLFAQATRYLPGTDMLRPNGFEVISLDGVSTGPIFCHDMQSVDDWMTSIAANITSLNKQSMLLANRLLLPPQQIVYMGWVSERSTGNKSLNSWTPRFLALKGPSVCLFDKPPVIADDWGHADTEYRIYDSVLKERDCIDGRQQCTQVETSGATHLFSVETRQELLQLEKAWYRATYQAVKHLGSKTFGCTWRGRISGLTLDLDNGFSVYDSEDKSFMWSYRFSQLKGSSDDGKSKLKLLFLSDDTQELETREVQCTNLQTLLYSMHAFLSAKLASVDPSFLFNL